MTEDWRAALRASRSRRLEPYLTLAATYPGWFEGPADGVVIATHPDAIAAIEEETAARYSVRGLPPAWAEVGLRYQDPYLALLVDAVTFPDGGAGVHHRVVRMADDDSGVAVLPVLDGQIVLIRHFRHPIRRWTWEIPRGAIDVGALPDNAVRRELLEEIEGQAASLRPLGAMYGATGFMALRVLLYMAELTSVGRPAVGEGVGEVRMVDVETFEAMVRSEDIVDGFTLGAFLRARLEGLI
jgi:ADP-ribose pyrophosphatase